MRFQGKTVDDAKAKACIQLEKTSKELKFDIIDSGKKGFLGIGSKPAIVEVEILGENKKIQPKKENKNFVKENKMDKKEKVEDKKDIVKVEEKVDNEEPQNFVIENEVKSYLKELIALMGVQNVEIEINVDEEQKLAYTNIVSDNSTVVIGKRGTVLDAIQVIINTVFGRERAGYWIKLDCDNYREKRQKTIESLAKRSASNVKKYKRRVVLDRLSANERRIIHSVLQHDKSIETYSEGRDPDRKLIIALKRNR